MQLYFYIALTAVAGLLGWAVTLLVEHVAAPMGLVQGPNERSSHTRPTPRGGGAAIAFAIVLSGTVLAMTGAPTLWIANGLTLCIGLLGFVDDLMDLSPALRFPIQGAVFTVLIVSAGPLVPIELGMEMQLGGWALSALLIVVGLWWLNLFNFMDGIDGIAAAHTILVLLGAALIWALSDASAWHAHAFWLAVASSAATAGFLIRNWPPARVFMGDAGSNALALAIFAIALTTVETGALGYPAWLILPSAFVADATVTVTRRTIRGERPWRAHRRHAYQQLSRLWGHRRVTLLYCALTALWAIPLALLSQLHPAWAWALTAIAYVPILAFAFWGRAGAADETRSRS
jgi:Fuc2NAc and GlcNAc transferase